MALYKFRIIIIIIIAGKTSVNGTSLHCHPVFAIRKQCCLPPSFRLSGSYVCAKFGDKSSRSNVTSFYSTADVSEFNI